ncbi:MAG: FtsX-like permease family protein [Clostridium sp.]|uniref:FtsX-like permease family protein n=1 Tax=Clostridium sp. TaxID=1506 RepID=UPI0029144694|nr:FtsX-like permease family protein [Clostridium sp.]MDU7337901.1 FtsX-like permease family protein [Clostridium sp.]
MKSYLSLIPISTKIHRKQNRMTLLCIIISVLLVTAIFSVSDMLLRTENSFVLERHGSWHIKLDNISQENAKEISQHSDVKAIGTTAVFNSDADKPYYIGKRKATLYGTDKTYITQLSNALEEGTFPQADNEIMLSENAKLALNVQLGDRVTLHTPAGDTDFKISGFGSDDKKYYQGQTFLVAVYMTQNSFNSLMTKNDISAPLSYYVQFQNAAKAAQAIPELKKTYDLPKDCISENTALMGISGQSNNQAMGNIYATAGFLFVLVLLAGVLMISGSLNSNVTQRTKFFGMLRCIGASRRQIIRFVRLEALNWCKIAIPIGIIAGTAVSWGICAWLHYGIGGEFITTPVFAFSPIGLVSGVLVGLITVLLAAQSPAKRAAKVSPVAAVSGNVETTLSVQNKMKQRVGKIEWMLGVHHATASKKNWALMTASFALSIILFLCFSIGLDLARGLLPTLRSWQPDITLNGYSNALVIEKNLTDEISNISGVKQVFSSSYKNRIPASSSRQGIDHINLLSYDDYLLNSAKDSVVQGDLSAIQGDSNKVITVYDKDNPLKMGDSIQIAGQEVKITSTITDSMYPSELLVICSQETFERLTGEHKYTTLGIHLNENANDKTLQQISNLTASDVIYTDLRESNKESNTTYLAFQCVVYGFLVIISMITMFYIINSISMSVSARSKQYGAMRAVGMDGRQLTRMIAAEAFTYAISGLAVGCGIGLPFSRFLYISLITRYFGTVWHLPVTMLCLIILFVFVSAVAAIYAPAKRIRDMAVIETINEL